MINASDRRVLRLIGVATIILGFMLIRAATEASGEVSRVVLREMAPVGMGDAFAFLIFGLAFAVTGIAALVVPNLGRG